MKKRLQKQSKLQKAKPKRNHFKLMNLTDNMKQYILFFSFLICLASCSIDDPSIITIQNADVVDIIAPDSLTLNQTEVFVVSFIKPTDCHTFESFDVSGEDLEVTIRTETRFEETFECQDTPNEIGTAQFEFTAENHEDHILKFLSGASESGQLQFITLELPVKIE